MYSLPLFSTNASIHITIANKLSVSCIHFKEFKSKGTTFMSDMHSVLVSGERHNHILCT